MPCKFTTSNSYEGAAMKYSNIPFETLVGSFQSQGSIYLTQFTILIASGVSLLNPLSAMSQHQDNFINQTSLALSQSIKHYKIAKQCTK